MREPLEPSADARVRIAVSRDAGPAEAWSDALIDAGIPARVEIDDDRNMPSDPPPLAPYVATRHVYTVSVPLVERERAESILAELREDEAPAESPDGRRLTIQIAIALGVTLGIVLVLVALG